MLRNAFATGIIIVSVVVITGLWLRNTERVRHCTTRVLVASKSPSATMLVEDVIYRCDEGAEIDRLIEISGLEQPNREPIEKSGVLLARRSASETFGKLDAPNVDIEWASAEVVVLRHHPDLDLPKKFELLGITFKTSVQNENAP